MSRFTMPVVALAAVLGTAMLTAAARTPRPDPVITQEQAGREVNALLQEVTRAANDPEALSRYYAPEAQIVDGSGLTVGWNTYRQRALPASQRMLARSAPSAARTASSSHYHVGNATVRASGNVAWAAFPYALTADVGGKPTEIFGYGTATLRREGNRWLIVQAQTAGRERRAADPRF